MEQSKERILDILYQQLQLLAEKIDEEEDLCCLRSMLCNFRHIARTILTNNPKEEQKKEILDFLFCQMVLLSEKKSVGLSDLMDDLANFIFNFF